MAQWIVNQEAQRDAQGRLKVYHLPANDGGGRFEVAGINERYDTSECLKLVAMLNAGQYAAAEREAAQYIASQTDAAANWTICRPRNCFCGTRFLTVGLAARRKSCRWPLVLSHAHRLPRQCCRRNRIRGFLFSVCVLRARNMSGRSLDEEPTWLPVSSIAGITCAMRR